VAAGLLYAAVLGLTAACAAVAGSAVLLALEDVRAVVRVAAAVLAVLVVVIVLDRTIGRLLPLATLLRLGLLFPGEAPERLRLALAAGSTRELVQLRDGQHEDASQAAERLLVLLTSLARHDPGTRRHSERVRAYVDLLADALDLPQPDRERLRWASLVHDLGKTEVDAAVLRKPSRLDADEWEQVRRHPADGARLAAGLVPFLGPWFGAIGDHHERYDGTGYPQGLVGEQISFAGRIVAVADAFEVMTAPRPYSRPVDPDAARAELVRCAGEQFDPQVVRALLAVPVGRLRRVAGPLALLGLVPALHRAAVEPEAAVHVGSDQPLSLLPPDPSVEAAAPLVGLPDGAGLPDGSVVAAGVVPSGADASGGSAPTGGGDGLDAAAAAAQR
jgi:HD-GYP domain-containing protein (c-di-GMP phosphodiesterase class II)